MNKKKNNVFSARQYLWICVLLLLCLLCHVKAKAENETSKYFPIGMTWEEETVTPQVDIYEATVFNTRLYEIGADTLVGDVSYRKVLTNGRSYGLCVRESGEKVWLRTPDYPEELLIYNFDWDGDEPIVTDYLSKPDHADPELCHERMNSGDYQTVTFGGREWQYHRYGWHRCVIRGLGKVAELNRFRGLLGYKESSPIDPGLEWAKVLWVKRNGEEVFRSDDHREWTYDVPTGISNVTTRKDGTVQTSNTVYDLQGRRVTGQPRRGVYIQDGRKRVR